MEYLVTMTTHVPGGVSEAAVDDMRRREAARARALAAGGHLLRLWRPPLQPGEWRTLGLFAAGDAGRLEEVLASMPLRIWRNDDVTPLAPHPNDPPSPPARRPGASEFLTTLTLTAADVDPEALDDARGAEARNSRKLAEQGYLVRLWRLHGKGGGLALWQVDDARQFEAILAALPLRRWLKVETIPLTEHPNDPALVSIDA